MPTWFKQAQLYTQSNQMQLRGQCLIDSLKLTIERTDVAKIDQYWNK